MPWAVALLRGQRVLARMREDGTFATEGGRVEIRYNKQDARAYRAAVANLQRVGGEPLLPDTDVVASAPVIARGSTPERVAKKSAAVAAAAGVIDADGWIAYTDGACSGNPGPAGAGMVIVRPGGVVREGYEYLGTATNNIAELTAILRAVEVIPASAGGALVHTDSQYSIGVLTKGWKAKVNQELIAKTRALLATRPGVRLRYVPGHAGVPLNERADELAREAIARRSTRALTAE